MQVKFGEVPPDLIDMYVPLRVKLAVDLSRKGLFCCNGLLVISAFMVTCQIGLFLALDLALMLRSLAEKNVARASSLLPVDTNSAASM